MENELGKCDRNSIYWGKKPQIPPHSLRRVQAFPEFFIIVPKKLPDLRGKISFFFFFFKLSLWEEHHFFHSFQKKKSSGPERKSPIFLQFSQRKEKSWFFPHFSQGNFRSWEEKSHFLPVFLKILQDLRGKKSLFFEFSQRNFRSWVPSFPN